MASLRDLTTNFVKLDKFVGNKFKRWQKKMLFFLATLKVVYVICTLSPSEKDDETQEDIRARSKWDNDDFICRGNILNGISDTLFDVYQNIKSAQEMWSLLETKYIAKDASIRSFLQVILIILSLMTTDP